MTLATPLRQRHRVRALVVDDHVDLADAVALVLKPHVLDVRVAYDGPSALALAAESSPDLIIADLAMPDMDGFELVARLRAQPRLAGTFILALTAFDPGKYRAATRMAGFDEHLVKPVTERQIMQLLDTMSVPADFGQGASGFACAHEEREK